MDIDNNVGVKSMFKGTDIKPFENKIWLASPTMHGEDKIYKKEIMNGFYRNTKE